MVPVDGRCNCGCCGASDCCGVMDRCDGCGGGCCGITLGISPVRSKSGGNVPVFERTNAILTPYASPRWIGWRGMPSVPRKKNLPAEALRLDEAKRGTKWRRWGTYLSERQWGTVREDYSENGDAWQYFTHEDAVSRAYRWGDDGLLGLCDNRGLINFAVALWNENDPYLKERLFGLTGPEGNHGEDVKEVYYYVDQTPTCSYARAVYKYPQRRFPYEELREQARHAGRYDRETQIWDTKAFDENRYFDVQVEYAKAD